MNNTNSKRGRRLILTIPPNMYLILEQSADKMGVSVLDYIRYLIMKESKEDDKGRERGT